MNYIRDMTDATKRNWTKEEILGIYNRPLLQLILDAAAVHSLHHRVGEVQISSLLSIKTGGCPEDCAYCPQAARYQTKVEVHKLMEVDEVLDAARNAKSGGASRFCMGAAWREVRNNRDFDRVLEMVQGVNSLGMEVCCTLGMLTEEQAHKLADAGLYAYNHNIDTSEENYKNIVSTRQFDERLATLDHVRKAGITMCSGGIIGMGESAEDRAGMLQTLANMEVQPHSVPINALVAVEGTPLENMQRISFDELVRMVATARIVMPQSDVRLSAGRLEMSMAEQALCFLAGANSIFAGDRLLTTPNPEFDQDQMMFGLLGLTPKAAFANDPRKTTSMA
jgi:biotin synthase